MKNKKRFLFRLIIPSLSENIFSGVMKKTIALGPVMVATAANKLFDWDVEIIHEVGSRKFLPRSREGNICHKTLQKERPADVVGFYCSISSTMPRVWEVAKTYKDFGVLTIAGGLHTHYEPLESLQKNIDLIVHGEGEKRIIRILTNFQEEKSFHEIPGISFLQEGKIKTNPHTLSDIGFDPCLDALPYPDFGLIVDCKIKEYPIGRIRGCGKNCEFCSVKDHSHWASAEKLFETVRHMVETLQATDFFIVDDRLEEDKEGSMRFFEMIKNKYGSSLYFTIQIRLEAAKDEKFLSLLRSAGVKRICIGYESPIDEELKIMRKGYKTSNMLEWTKKYHDFGFFIHAMFIFGYPGVNGKISATERMKRFKNFIKQGQLDSIQVLKPIPLVGSDLRTRLIKEKKILPLEIVPWSKYDGNHVCFLPEDMSLREMEYYPFYIMGWFYHFRSLWRIILRTIIMPIDYFLRGWRPWFRGWWNDIIRFGGNLLYRKLIRQNKKEFFIRDVENYLINSHKK